jgi:hypothetical protein
MRRPAAHVVSALVLALTASGCGGGGSASSTAPDRAACDRVETKVRDVSQLVGGTVDLITQSVRRKELARRTGEGRRNLLYAASVLSRVDTPPSLAPAWHELIAGLRQVAGDFGRAQKAVQRNDMATAATQLADRSALAKLQASTRKIDRVCGVKRSP